MLKHALQHFETISPTIMNESSKSNSGRKPIPKYSNPSTTNEADSKPLSVNLNKDSDGRETKDLSESAQTSSLDFVSAALNENQQISQELGMNFQIRNSEDCSIKIDPNKLSAVSIWGARHEIQSESAAEVAKLFDPEEDSAS